MQITIKWNNDLGEARLTPSSKKMIKRLLKEGSGGGGYDVQLVDFLTDCSFICYNAKSAALRRETDFKEGI